MENQKRIVGYTEDEIWEQLTKDLKENGELLEYNVTIKHADKEIALSIDIDLGGGFESGYETTSLVSPLQSENDFRFVLHKQDFLDEVGKFFGMQDVVLGYPEFDRNVIVKTNDEKQVKEIFSDAAARQVLQEIEEDFTFATTTHHATRVLEFTIEKGITEATTLRKFYNTFYKILTELEK